MGDELDRAMARLTKAQDKQSPASELQPRRP